MTPTIRRLAAGLCALVLVGLLVLPGAEQRAGAAGSSAAPHGPGQVAPRSSRIVEENRRPGTTAWQSDSLHRLAAQRRAAHGYVRDPHPERPAPWGARVAPLPAAADTWVDSAIRGYPDQTSVHRGAILNLRIGATRPIYTLEVYRMGWYDGTGGRLLLTVPGLPGQNQPVPPPDPSTGVIAANWQVSYALQTGADWVSGVYLVKLITDTAAVGYIPFVLRDDGASAAIVYQVPVTTYQAYNNWGGKSLYDYQSPTGRAYKVSFDRPYANWNGAGLFFDGDYNMIRFLEREGYDLTYVTSIDVQANPNLLAGRKVFLSNWHDEYWSRPMRDHITAARDAGKHLAWFDPNNVYWQIRFEPSASGVPNRVMVCYKDAALDPVASVAPALTTVRFRDPPVNQPENALLGIMFESLFPFGTSFPWVVSSASHWVYAGTGLQDGQTIPGLVGYEYDRVANNGLTPSGLQVLANSPVVDINGVASTHNASIYTAPGGALVFSAGTNYFAWKVDDNEFQARGTDARAQQIVRNVLNTMAGGPPPTRTPTPTRTATPTPTATRTPGCAPRPRVTVEVAPSGAGRLQVTVATEIAAGAALRSIDFGGATNALIDAGPLVGSRGHESVAITPGVTSFVFYVRRDQPGRASQVPLTVNDTCGAWPTFVGGGPSAF